MNKRWNSENEARQDIMSAVEAFYHQFIEDKREFQEGDKRPYSGRVFDEKQMRNLADATLDFWLTSGRFVNQFESDFAKWLGVKYTSTVNSGSSANLLAFAALTAPELGDRAIRRGDEVITVAAAFPTTVTPILNFGAIPVFVDVTIPEYNIDITKLEEAYSPKTKAVMIAHTLGNPFDLMSIKQFCDHHNLWLVEDNCDALGGTYTINGEEKKVGTIGDIGTSSFYPPHHITMGEGGCVYTNNPLLHRLIRSFRDWGRDCMCAAGQDDMCGHRFDRQFGELPEGYDHKFVYSHFGYNLKITDMQAAVGCAQLKKLDKFVDARRENWKKLYDGLSDMQDKIILPKATENSNPSWFGFLMTLHDDINCVEVIKYIEAKGIQTRRLFGGNLLRHPCFDELRQNEEGFRVVGSLENTDRIMNHSFWVGVYPGMTDEKIDYIVKIIKEAINAN